MLLATTPPELASARYMSATAAKFANDIRGIINGNDKMYGKTIATGMAGDLIICKESDSKQCDGPTVSITRLRSAPMRFMTFA